VLFWDPECRFCRETLPALKAWEDDSPQGSAEAPCLLDRSGGSQPGDGPKLPVLLDQHLAVGRGFGVPGAPSALLLDEQGQIASELAEGAMLVLALARADSD
jgi:hypothetical protein